MKSTSIFLAGLVLLVIGCKTKEKKEATSQDLIPYSIVKVRGLLLSKAGFLKAPANTAPLGLPK